MIDRTVFRVGIWLAGLLLAVPAVAADDLEKAMALPVAGGLVGARDVPRFAWVESKAGVRNVWVADRGKPARPITTFTEDDGLPIYDLSYSRDGSALAYVRGGDPEYPDEEEAPNPASAANWPRQQLFVTVLDGSAPTLIGSGHAPTFSPDGQTLAYTYRGSIYLWSRGSEAKRVAKLGGDADNLSWSPDGKRLLFTDNRGNHSFVGLLDIGDGNVRYIEPALAYAVEPTFSPDGSRIAFIRFVSPPTGASDDGGPYWSIRIADVATGTAHALWSAPQGVGGAYAGTRGGNLFWGADDKIAFSWERSGWIHAYAVDAAGGVPRELTPGAFEIDTYTLSPDRKSLVYAANGTETDRHHLFRVALSGGAPVALTRGEGVESYPVFGGDSLAATATDVLRPAYPALVDKGRLAPIGTLSMAQGFVTPQAVLLKADDGVLVHAQLFRAKGNRRHPALIFVHGGPRRQMLLGFHPSAYYSNAYIMNQHLAAQGYDVLSVNYRSGTGYGRAFREAPGIAREGAAEYRDVLAGGRWLAAQAHVDRARIGIWGGSWGGYLTALALARNSDLFAAGVDFHGVHAMVRPLEGNVSPAAQAAAQQLQWASSPMGAIDTWRSPVLLIHGDDDKNVPFAQSILLARELSARHIPYRDIAWPNERHGFLRYGNWLASYRAMDAFLADTLMKKAAQ